MLAVGSKEDKLRQLQALTTGELTKGGVAAEQREQEEDERAELECMEGAGDGGGGDDGGDEHAEDCEEQGDV